MRPSDGPPSTKPCGSAPASRRSLSPSSLSPSEVSPSEPSPSSLSPSSLSLSGLESPWLSSAPESSNSVATSAEWPGVDRLSTAGRSLGRRDPSAEIRLPRSVSLGSTAAFLFAPDAFAATLLLGTGGFTWRCSCSDASSDARAGGTSSSSEEEHAMVCRRGSLTSFGLASFASRSSSGTCACKSSTAQQSRTRCARRELA